MESQKDTCGRPGWKAFGLKLLVIPKVPGRRASDMQAILGWSAGLRGGEHRICKPYPMPGTKGGWVDIRLA